MIVKYLTGTEKVLEIGGNLGLTSLIIAYILNTRSNCQFVSLETLKNKCEIINTNKTNTNLFFFVENSALSNNLVIQHPNYTQSIPSNNLLEDYEFVQTISWNNLLNKYHINFDTLIIDCKGFFFYILQSNPEILKNINLIIVENDYIDMQHKEYVDNLLIDNKFYLEYSESGNYGTCFKNYFEVWKK
jgi:FkbM family methyltransferase